MFDKEITIGVTQEELILRMMPFTNVAKQWYLNQPEIAKALKIFNADRFISLGGVSITSSPIKPNDEVLGFFVYDYKQKKVKQDFIVNLGSTGTEFVLYTKLPIPVYGEYVRPIEEFYKLYGGDGLHYVDTHHPKEQDLHPAIAERLIRAKEIARKRIQHVGPIVKTQDELNEIDSKLKGQGY